MPVELRKRKARDPPPAPPPKKTSATKGKGAPKSAPKKAVKKAAAKVDEVKEKAKEAVEEQKPEAKESKAAAPAVGDTIDLEGFGGEIETNDGTKTTLKKLVEESKAGVVLFTYPKASTPGCTKQVCFFRDSYEPITKAGFSIYGLSADSGKANTTFKTKYELQYPLLCDGSRSLITAIGLKKAPSGTQRGVFVVDKAGKVLAAEPGSPQGTVDVVVKIAEGMTINGETEKKE